MTMSASHIGTMLVLETAMGFGHGNATVAAMDQAVLCPHAVSYCDATWPVPAGAFSDLRKGAP